MSIPTSAIASTAAALISLAGSEPPEYTGDAGRRRGGCNQPAAICDRPALCTHRNSTEGAVMVSNPSTLASERSRSRANRSARIGTNDVTVAVSIS